jgi:TonB family protein
MTATAGQRTKPPSKRRTLVVTIAAAAALIMIWAGARTLRTHQSDLTPPTADIAGDADVTDVTAATPPATQADATLAAPNEPAAPFESSNTRGESSNARGGSTNTHTSSIATTTNHVDTNANDTSADPEPEVSAGAVTQVMPEVPRRARQTIRGHVKVSVRLIIDQDGSVFAALVDDVGPSRYFSRLAIEAAKKWTFAPVNTDGQRFVQVRFDFTRDGTTARAFPLK